jgi:phosphate starvation-inducible membrane PsiE
MRVTRHRTSSQHIKVCTFDFKIVGCAQKEDAWQYDVSDAGIIFYLFFFNSCVGYIQSESHLTLIFKLKAHFLC